MVVTIFLTCRFTSEVHLNYFMYYVLRVKCEIKMAGH